MANQTAHMPPGYHAITPSLTFKNTLKAIEFYKKAFGAKLLEEFRSPDGKSVMHAVIQIGDSVLMMGDENPGCQSAETLQGSPIGLYLYVPDADTAFHQAVTAGASVAMPMADMFWGDRFGSVKDPFGYSWMIATRTRELTPDQIRKGADEFFAKVGKP